MKILVLIVTLVISSGHFVNEPKDYLGIKGPLEFGKTKFELAFSDKPTDTYYLQEYLPKGESLEAYNQMLTINLFNIAVDAEKAVNKN